MTAYRAFLPLSRYISLSYLSGSPVKELSLQVPLMESPQGGMLLGSKGGRCVGLTTLLLSYSDCLEILVFSTFCSPKGLFRSVIGRVYLFLNGYTVSFLFYEKTRCNFET